MSVWIILKHLKHLSLFNIKNSIHFNDVGWRKREKTFMMQFYCFENWHIIHIYHTKINQNETQFSPPHSNISTATHKNKYVFIDILFFVFKLVNRHVCISRTFFSRFILIWSFTIIWWCYDVMTRRLDLLSILIGILLIILLFNTICLHLRWHWHQKQTSSFVILLTSVYSVFHCKHLVCNLMSIN